MSQQDLGRLSDEKEGRTLVGGGSSSSSNKYKRIMDTSLLDEFGLSANLERGSKVHSPNYMWMVQQRRHAEANEGLCRPLSGIGERGVFLVYPSTRREETGYSAEWTQSSRSPDLDRFGRSRSRSSLSSGVYSTPYFSKHGRTAGFFDRTPSDAVSRGRGSLGSFSSSSSSIVSPSIAMTKSGASSGRASSIRSSLRGGGVKQLLAAYGGYRDRRDAWKSNQFSGSSVKGVRSGDLLASSAGGVHKGGAVSEQANRRDSIKIEGEEALADACGCRLCGTFMQYRLRGRKNDDNSEELVADIWCTGDKRSEGSEVGAPTTGRVPESSVPFEASGVQLTAGLKSLIEILEADTDRSSKKGLDNYRIDAIVSHRYYSDIGGVKCSICMDELRSGDLVKGLPCLHTFHTKCIDHWLRVNHRCPICKYDITRRR
ncbi:hypothetical protein FOZ61_004017 [Perkinsus olseni]|uniref:RING-type domain-containing protein n=1 Tax=Perkinsus olseni TaxID=32597 RepID=A0A7J6LND1_PEROL|nr:hypothetical protein FOZ61_004017 [Perkinsus olseni]